MITHHIPALSPRPDIAPFPRLAFAIATAFPRGKWYLDDEVHATLADAADRLPDAVDSARPPYADYPRFAVLVFGDDRPMRNVTFEACRLLVARAVAENPPTDPLDRWVEEHLPQWLELHLGEYLPGLIDHAARDAAAEAAPLGALEVM